MLKQKAKLRWVVDGDENTKMFHAAIKFREWKNQIRGMFVDSNWTEEPEKIKEHVHIFFKDKFSSNLESGPTISSEKFKKLSREEALDLEKPFTEEETWAAIKECGNDKSPGSDGFSFGFVKRFWGTIKKYLMVALGWFWETEKISGGCNPSFLALIPKTKNPSDLGEYKPISLIGVFYKIIAKVMASRLFGVMERIISNVQSAFIKGRYILDGILIANEVVNLVRKEKLRGLVFKVDFEKAYDSVEWKFLLDTMRNMGFRRKWCGLIKACLSSSSVSVLVNGSPGKEFKMAKGLRQGDPLAPFLFLISAESLHVLVEEAKERGLYEGIKVGDDTSVSHLQYADDVVFFSESGILII